MTDHVQLRKPAFPLTVPEPLYTAVALATKSQEFADSYLWGARLDGLKLTPRTHVAWERIKFSKGARAALRAAGIDLVEPIPFGEPGGDDIPAKMRMPELFAIERRRRPGADF